MRPEDEAARAVSRMFLGATPKRRRRKPNRCIGCGKVSRHIFCKDTWNECRALYDAKKETK